MAKKDRKMENENSAPVQEMTLEQAKAYRASLYKPEEKVLGESEKREQFRLFWATQKSLYGKGRELEEILWLHLKASKMDEPSQFEAGLKHFGLKKLGN